MANTTLSLFPARIKIVNQDGTMTPEFYRALQVIVSRLGGALGDTGGDVFVTQIDYSTFQAGGSSSDQVFADMTASSDEQVIADMASQLMQQPVQSSTADAMLFQPPTSGGGVAVVTAGASPYVFTAQKEGFLSVQGGTVSGMNFFRGAAVVGLGFISGVVPLNEGDKVSIAYTVAPTINFIPR